MKSVAAGEGIEKIGVQMQAELTRQMGSREAASVYTATANRVPGLDKTPGGNKIMLGALSQGLQRDVDLDAYRQQWLGDPTHHNSIAGMERSFNQSSPPEMYSSSGDAVSGSE